MIFVSHLLLVVQTSLFRFLFLIERIRLVEVICVKFMYIRFIILVHGYVICLSMPFILFALGTVGSLLGFTLFSLGLKLPDQLHIQATVREEMWLDWVARFIQETK